MLAIIQRLDPSGTGARDLRECLLIQLVELGDTTSLTYRLVNEAFPDLIAHRWNDLLANESLRSLCEEHSWQLTFVPHPNMQGYLDGAQLPAHVHALRFSDVDVQVLIADAAALVTDWMCQHGWAATG